MSLMSQWERHLPRTIWYLWLFLNYSPSKTFNPPLSPWIPKPRVPRRHRSKLFCPVRNAGCSQWCAMAAPPSMGSLCWGVCCSMYRWLYVHVYMRMLWMKVWCNLWIGFPNIPAAQATSVRLAMKNLKAHVDEPRLCIHMTGSIKCVCVCEIHMTVRDSYDRRMLKTRCVCKPTCLNCGCWCHINWANIITSDRPCSSVLCPAKGVRFSWFSLPSSLYFSQLFQRNIEIHLEPPWVLAPRKRVLPPVLPWPGDWALSQWNKSRDFWRACRPGIVPRQHVSSVARSSFCEDFVGEMEKYFCSFCVCMPGNKLSTMSRSLSSFLESFYFF